MPNGYSNFQTKCFTICAKLYLNIISLQVQQQVAQKQRQQRRQRQRQWQHWQTSRRCQRMRFEVRRSSRGSTRYQHNVLTATVFVYVYVCECICVFYFPSASAKKASELHTGLGICGCQITLRLKAIFECSNF